MCVKSHIKLSIIGFDTETRPAFKKGQVFPVSLLQLATSDQAFLFRINKIGLPAGLVKILTSSKILKIGESCQIYFGHSKNRSIKLPDIFEEQAENC